jgi:hypothetical protein
VVSGTLLSGLPDSLAFCSAVWDHAIFPWQPGCYHFPSGPVTAGSPGSAWYILCAIILVQSVIVERGGLVAVFFLNCSFGPVFL